MPKKAEVKEPEKEEQGISIPVTPDVNSIIIETFKGVVENNKLIKELLEIAKEE